MSTTRRIPGTIAIAVLLSAAAHVALALAAGLGEPVVASSLRGDAVHSGGTLHATLRTNVPSLRSAATMPVPATTERSVASIPTPPRTVPRGPSVPEGPARADATGVIDGPDAAAPSAERPTPITYPVIDIPADDDPNRVGLVRMVLVVSSEGAVVRTVVTATTLTPAYVERIARSFEQMRFRPAMRAGLPRAGWYEVVVNFDFDPEARTRL